MYSSILCEGCRCTRPAYGAWQQGIHKSGRIFPDKEILCLLSPLFSVEEKCWPNKHEHATIARSPGGSTVTKKWTVFHFLSAKTEYREINKKSLACFS